MVKSLPVLIALLLLMPCSYAQDQGQDRAPKFSGRQPDKTGTEHLGFLAGLWVPAGNLQLIGNHPYLGLQWGFRHRQHDFNISIELRFLQSQNIYEVERSGSLYELKDYTGGYIGIDYINYLFNTGRSEIGILAGMGYDGFSLNRARLPSRPYEIGSLNVNGGVQFNWYTRGTTYFGIQIRYNIIHYRNPGGSSLRGNAESFGIFVEGLWEAGAERGA